MLKIFKYTLFDLVRNRWLIIYTIFFILITLGLLLITSDFTKVIISLSNITLVISPLIGIMYGVMYYYSSSEFLTFLLAQPLSRKSIFSGFFAGIACTLSLSLLIGIGLPLLLYGVAFSPEFKTFAIVLTMAVILSVVFSLIAFIIALRHNNRIKGFGVAIFTWLFFAVVYDGIFLLLLLIFRDYPLENLTLILTMANPIDLARILVLMNLDISAMMGYTGAVLESFFGKSGGTVIISFILFLWISLPFAWIIKLIDRKDF